MPRRPPSPLLILPCFSFLRRLCADRGKDSRTAVPNCHGNAKRLQKICKKFVKNSLQFSRKLLGATTSKRVCPRKKRVDRLKGVGSQGLSPWFPGVERGVGLLTWLDTADQFPNYVIFAGIGCMVYTFPLKTPKLYHTPPSGAIGGDISQRFQTWGRDALRRVRRD